MRARACRVALARGVITLFCGHFRGAHAMQTRATVVADAAAAPTAATVAAAAAAAAVAAVATAAQHKYR